MPADPAWYDSVGVALGTAAPQIAGSAGAPGTALQLQLWNDKDESGADPFPASQLFGYARLTTSGQPLVTGAPLVDRRMVEVRITGGLGGKSVPAGAWTPLGTGSYLAIPSLSSGEGVSLEFRLYGPGDAQGANVYLVTALFTSPSSPIGPGIPEIIGNGIYLGIGDPLTSSVLFGEDVVENPAGADGQVQIGTFVWLASGVVRTYHAALSSIAASTTGMNRYVLVSLDDDGTITLTDGDEVAGALTDDDRPDTPAGEIPVAYIQRDDGASIVDADITNIYTVSSFHLSHSGLSVTVGPGRALVDNALIHTQSSQSVTLTALSTNSLWLLRDGQLSITTTGLPPTGTRPLLLAEYVTDASTVTAFHDRRRFIGFRLHTLRLEWPGTLVTGQFRYAINPSDRPVYFLPIRGLRASISSPGTGSGSTRWQVQMDATYDDTWSDLTAVDHAPEIDVASTDMRDIDAIPAEHAVPAGARIRAQIDAIPSGADSEDGVLEILLVESA